MVTARWLQGAAGRGLGGGHCREPQASSGHSRRRIHRLESDILPGMSETEPLADARSMRLYAGVLVCEALTIAALWAFERMFS
jgi:hypothetical protein